MKRWLTYPPPPVEFSVDTHTNFLMNQSILTARYGPEWCAWVINNEMIEDFGEQWIINQMRGEVIWRYRQLIAPYARRTRILTHRRRGRRW